jgi:hypothetical protein
MNVQLGPRDWRKHILSPLPVFACGGRFFFAHSAFAFAIKSALWLYAAFSCAAWLFAVIVLWCENP